MTPVVAALRAEIERVSTLLESLPPADYGRETRCPPMRLHELVAHTLRGGVRIQDMIEAGPVETEPEKDGATYFQYDASTGAVVVERAFQAAKEYPVETLFKRWNDEWATSLDGAEALLAKDDLVYPSVLGLIKLSEYLRTRAVEVVIHHMDMRDALGIDPDPDPAALDVVCGVLANLLGTDPRALGMEGVRFALVGTGRAALADQERSMLGPLSERIPVLS